MPTMKASGEEIVRVSVHGRTVDDLLGKEWLLTNARGGYAASTVIGCNTSGYHGLLIGSLTPPVNRVMALSNCLETVVCGSEVFQLSTFEFPDRQSPAGYTHLHEFWRDTGAHFLYRLDSIEVHKAIYLARDSDTIMVEYEFHNVHEPIEFLLRPFVGLRDFHTLQKSHTRMNCENLGSGVRVRQEEGPPGELLLACPEMPFEADPQWWYNFTYRVNRHRGLHYTEDLWAPGVFRGRIGPESRIVFWARFDAYGEDACREGVQCVEGVPRGEGILPLHPLDGARRQSLPRACRGDAGETQGRDGLATRGQDARDTILNADSLKSDLMERQEELIRLAAGRDKVERILTLAADQFIVARTPGRRGESEKLPQTGECHCEERSDEAISVPGGGDCFASLAMTNRSADIDSNASSLQPPAFTTILAGYPWFMDWGRDAFIALPGLLLATGRHEEARSILSTFAAAADQGMIPNRFDDRANEVHFNSVDASLWFIHAAFEYLDATESAGERVEGVPPSNAMETGIAGRMPASREGKMPSTLARDTFSRDLLPVIRSIIDSYHSGTRFNIHADSDGLIVAGDKNTQLTWMDAMCDGIAFTPRHGKAVEVNALWHHALRRMAEFLPRASCLVPRATGHGSRVTALRDLASRYAQMAEQVGESFVRVFWNADLGYLNDTVLPDGTVDSSLRPNQIFAVSLAYDLPLTRQQQRAVVVAVEGELLTPYGLRTLNRRHPCYQGRYEGSPRQRDEAYHQGTVWPWLIGPFVEAWLRVHDFTPDSRNAAARMLEPLTRHLTETGCLGSISEIFDADPPHRPAGCPAQAWSVAELLRARRMVTDTRFV